MDGPGCIAGSVGDLIDIAADLAALGMTPAA